MTQKEFTFGSLFSGIGGMDLGLERAGMVCKFQVEIDEYASKVLAKHWPTVPRFRDVRDVGIYNLTPVDLIAGGFPCQDISNSGQRRGIDGERSGLWSEFYRIICELRPRFVFVENVPGLYVRGMGTVLGDLAEGGYDTEWDCVPAAAVGAPHIRERVFIFAHTRCQSGHFRQAGVYGCDQLVESGNDRIQGERGKDRKLYPMVSGVHPRTPTDWWRTQSRMDRSADGISNRMERLRGLGNAVVPQVAEWIGRRILEAA